MANQAKLLQRVMGKQRTEDIVHSSGYAQTQSGANFGSASIESFEKRQSIDDHRKFVQGYKNAQIMRSAYGLERAKRYIPGTRDSRSGNSRFNRGDNGEIRSGRDAMTSNRGDVKNATVSSREAYMQRMDSMKSTASSGPVAPASRGSQIAASFKPSFK